MLEICAALTAICKIVTDDMIPAVITDVFNFYLNFVALSLTFSSIIYFFCFNPPPASF
jgi:hypothetical protein